MSPPLPPLPDDGEPTRATLHAYALAVSAITRAHAVPHPRWWHLGLAIRPDGLVTEAVPLDDGRSLAIRMDLRTHEIVLEASDARGPVVGMAEGLTGTEMGDRLIDLAAGYGLDGPYERHRFEDDAPRAYVPEHAHALFAAFTAAQQIFTVHRTGLRGELSPINVWPHGFDVSFEWFGSRVVAGEEGNAQAQLNLGFYPKGRAYFYSNPWPFPGDVLAGSELPSGATWHTDGWEGSILYYDQVAGRPDGRRLVLEYAAAVHELAAPTLSA